MNVTEVRALIALSNKNKRAIRAEAALQLREVDSRLQDSLLRWGQKEFTPETIWDTGVLRKFMPYAQLEDVSNLHGGKPVTLPLTKHLQEVIVKVAQTYVADAHFAYHYLYGGSSIILTDPFGAEEFLTRLSTYPKVRVPFASIMTSNESDPDIRGARFRKSHGDWNLFGATGGRVIVRSHASPQGHERFTTVKEALEFIVTQDK